MARYLYRPVVQNRSQVQDLHQEAVLALLEAVVEVLDNLVQAARQALQAVEVDPVQALDLARGPAEVQVVELKVAHLVGQKQKRWWVRVLIRAKSHRVRCLLSRLVK